MTILSRKEKLKPPCLRNLSRYKDGCPEREYDRATGEGCTAWKELSVGTRGNPLQKEIRKQCIDLWAWEFQWATLGMVEGNAAAIESFRNGMCEQIQDARTGKVFVRPKPDPAIIRMLEVMDGNAHAHARSIPLRVVRDPEPESEPESEMP